MISYKISYRELKSKIEKHKKGWSKRAKVRTENIIKAGVYKEDSSIWSEIKPVYMELQGESKCAYCERKLESRVYGRGEQDVEHFRPKKNVKNWNSNTSIKTTDVSQNRGYPFIAYHLFNYAASCKPCNSNLKGNFFPIQGNYNFKAKDPRKMSSEKALLVYPIGEIDEAEDIITFHGMIPIAKNKRGVKMERAKATIEIFKLDAVEGRSNLILERAQVIVAVFQAFDGVKQKRNLKENKVILASTQSSKMQHANCARSFHKLLKKDFKEGKEIFELASAYIDSKS